MNAETVLGQAIVDHLDTWLEREFPNRDDHLRAYMLNAAADDFDWLDRGWWKLYDHLTQ